MCNIMQMNVLSLLNITNITFDLWSRASVPFILPRARVCACAHAGYVDDITVLSLWIHFGHAHLYARMIPAYWRLGRQSGMKPYSPPPTPSSLSLFFHLLDHQKIEPLVTIQISREGSEPGTERLPSQGRKHCPGWKLRDTSDMMFAPCLLLMSSSSSSSTRPVAFAPFYRGTKWQDMSTWSKCSWQLLNLLRPLDSDRCSFPQAEIVT